MLQPYINIKGEWVRVLTEDDIKDLVQMCKNLVLEELNKPTFETDGLESFIQHFND